MDMVGVSVISKGKLCVGCPLYGNGRGFVPDEIKPGAKVLILAQNPGADEEAQGLPMVGKTGQMMDKSFLPLAGLSRDDVSVGNAIRCRWQGGNELPPLEGKLAREAIDHCTKAHGNIPKETKLIVAQGSYALYALTGEQSISAWRGWVLPGKNHFGKGSEGIYTPGPLDIPVLATLHLASLFHEPAMQDPTRKDWGKIASILAGKWPEALPAIQTQPPRVWPANAAFDTEFVVPTGELIRYSLAWREPDGEPKVYVIEARDAIRSLVPEEAQDLAVLEMWRTKTSVRSVPLSSVLLRPTLASESDQDADMSWMRQAEHTIYTGRAVQGLLVCPDGPAGRGDRADYSLPSQAPNQPLHPVSAQGQQAAGIHQAAGASGIDDGPVHRGDPGASGQVRYLRPTNASGPGPLSLYWPGEGLPLFTVQHDAWVDGRQHGLVPSDGRIPCRVILQNAPADLGYLAQLLPPGTWVDLHDTLIADARLWSDLAHDLDFLGSCYARTNRWKHLSRSSPLVYSGADALGTWDVWQDLRRQLDRDPQTEAVYRKSLACWPIIHKAHMRGLRVDRARARAALVDLRTRVREAELEAQASVGYPISLGSAAQVAREIYDVQGLGGRKR